jgi:adenylate cyclase
VPVDELRAAVAEDRLVLVPIERALLGPPKYTLAEVAEQAGLEPEAAAMRLRTLGVSVPEDESVRAFGDDDARVLERTAGYIERGIGIGEGRQIMHVFTGAMSRVAEPMRRLFAETYLKPGISEEELALRFAEMAGELVPLVAADLEYLLRLHLRDFARHDALTAAERGTGQLPEAVDAAVAFADIVGFTALGEEVAEEKLTDIAEQLDRLATEHVRAPARVVKMIGDAVMVVARDPQPVVEAMLDLVEAAAQLDGMPPVRAGIAFGRAVPRLGDWFGPTVNLAARLTSRARPDSVLTSNAVRDSLGDGASAYAFSEAGLKRLKGISEPVPALRVRRAEEQQQQH